LNGASPVSASIGASLVGIGTMGPDGTSRVAEMRCTGSVVSDSTAAPQSTERSCAVMSRLPA